MGNSRFDQPISRAGTWCAKWDMPPVSHHSDAIALSVADMEFTTCPAAQAAVERAAGRGVYGYTEVFEDFADAAASWQFERHGWVVDPTSVIFFPRVVQMLSCLLQDHYDHPPTVAYLSPSYSPMREVMGLAGCRILHVPLIEETWNLDYDALDDAMRQADILLWCSPHNPTGRVWNRNELTFIAERARQYRTLIVSDDVHADLVRQDHTYTSLGQLFPDLSAQGLLITAFSPGKTFNMAGLEATAVVVDNPELRATLCEAKRRYGLHNPNYFAIPAAITAWREGGPWLDSLLTYVDGNFDYVARTLTAELPSLNYTIPEGTYLSWVDLKSLGLTEQQRDAWWEAARVFPTPGEDFGEGYESYARFNLAIPRETLREALNRLAHTYH